MKIERLTIEVDLQTDMLEDEAFVDTLKATTGVIGLNVKATKQLYPPVEEPAKPQTWNPNVLYRGNPDDFRIPVKQTAAQQPQLVYKGWDINGNSLIEVHEGDVNEHLAAITQADHTAVDAVRRDTIDKAADWLKSQAIPPGTTTTNPQIEAFKRSVTPPLMSDPSKTATISWVKPKDFE